MRFPASYGDQVVFSYAGDLYTISKGESVARKLTSDAGYEMFPRFSPDGKRIAFSGQYDGNTEVPISVPLKPATRYLWRVHGINDCGQGPVTPVREFVTNQ